MSVSLGLYDVFANIVPGLLFLYVFDKVIELFGLQSIDLNQVDTLGEVLAIIIIAFVLGNVVASLTFKNWYRLFFKKHAADLALDKLRSLHPKLKFDFDTNDGEIIFAIIKHHDKLLAEKIETSRVNSIMMRNISFGMFLYALLEVYLLISQLNLLYLGSSLVAIVLSIICFRRAVTMDRWFYQDTFRESLNYGSNIQEMLAMSKGKTTRKSTKKVMS